MIDFEKLLSADQIACIEATHQTKIRLYGLPDRFLARELIRLARQARQIAIAAGDSFVKETTYPTYNATLLWSLIPELAYRLGETDFLPNERADADLRAADTPTLRWSAATILRNCDLDRRYGYDQKSTPNACLLVAHNACNGNPVAMAIDRLCPPTSEANDPLAQHIREVGRCRFGLNTNISVWTPAFMNWRQNTSNAD